MRALSALTVALAMALPVPALAEYRKIDGQAEFAGLVSGRELTRMGITLTVSPGGEIRGRAFGQDVSGSWTWQDGYFCRDLFWGDQAFGYNCQEVALNGSSLRFTSDRGAGRSAALRLR